MSNFDFLEKYGQRLVKNGNYADKYLYDDPDGCANKLRKIAEGIALQVVKEKHLDGRWDKYKPLNKATFDENLIAIRDAHITSPDVIDDFYLVKSKGNDGSHFEGDDVSVEDAERALRATHRIAVWFVHDYKDCKDDQIPTFVLPQKDQESDKAVKIGGLIKKLFGSRAARWSALILSSFGLMWLWQIRLDKEHRWDASLIKTMRIVFILGILILLALPVMIVAHIATLWGTYSYFVSYLSGELGWNSYLIRALVLAFLLPFLYAVKMFASPLNKERRMRGAILLIVMSVGCNIMLYSATKNAVFNLKDGHPIKYYVKTDHGIVIHDRDGYDEDSGQRLLPMTPEIWRDYTIQGNEAFAKVDPHTTVWFNQYNGNPMLWYDRSSNGELEFYNRWGNDLQTGDRLLPVTKEVQKTWEAEEAIAKQKNAPADPLMKALNPGAGKSEPGIYLRSQDEAGREGIDALEIPPSGLNRSALRADVIERQGYGNRLMAETPACFARSSL